MQPGTHRLFSALSTLVRAGGYYGPDPLKLGYITNACSAITLELDYHLQAGLQFHPW
jgi:hypothetical protein